MIAYQLLCCSAADIWRLRRMELHQSMNALYYGDPLHYNLVMIRYILEAGRYSIALMT